MPTPVENVPQLILSNAPHIRAGQSVRTIMWMVAGALVPAAVFSVYTFGINALMVITVGVASAVISEAIYLRLLRKPVTVSDGSAVITGLLLAMNVPPDVPLWVTGIGSAFSIIIAKQLFGGLGYNIFNPALAGRAFLMASWPVYMTTRWHHFSPLNVLSGNAANIAGLPNTAYDTITQATPLGALKEIPKILADLNITPEQFYTTLFSKDIMKSLFIGNTGGCVGETSAALLLLGGLFLLYKRIISWHIPVSYIGTVAIITAVYYALTGSPYVTRAVLFHLLSGGLMLGAFFMATDMVTSPVTHGGMIIMGIGCGIITCVIRLFGGYPEGVSYSILLMNATVPLIDRFTKPRVFGTGKR